MSLIFMDGFDLYSSSSDTAFTNIYTMGGSSGFSTSNGRFGGGALTIYGYSGHTAFNLPSPETEFWFGMAYANTSNSNGNFPVFFFNSINGIEASIYYNPANGTWFLCSGDYNVTLSTVTKSIGTSGAYHWLEFHYKMGSSTGILELWVDGNSLLDLTSVNTNYRGGSSIISIQWGGDNNAINGYIDDMYVTTISGGSVSGRLGDGRIETLKPTSDASPNNGTLTTGTSHYAMVDENQNDGSTSTITLANTSGQEELFGISSLSGSPATVHAVKVTAIAEKTDAGSCNLEVTLVSGGTVANGPSTGLTTAFNTVSGIFETDPNTSSAWLYTNVNAAQIGFQVP